ncbi:MAG: hypothetical protein HOM47_06265 [Euryarchaeota archaeon]|nr:hypothetical protein [Euryarchaeota archaeon]MBT5184759.1 hypothetical protein [Euryarchaeota archaeon]
MKKNHILWLIALFIVNSGWYFVSQQSASQEINRSGADFSGEREAKIGTIIGTSVDYELEHCFDSVNGGVYEASIKVEFESVVVYSWNGTTDDGCITFSSTSEEGTLLITTELEEGGETTTTLYTWPLKSAIIPGAVLFSIGTLIVAYGETSVRTLLRKRFGNIEADGKAIAGELKPNETEVQTSPIWQEPKRPQ